MLKITALLFNTFALLIYQLFFADVVTITQNIPATAKAETEFIVELTINKGTSGGFAKLQQELPVGFTAIEDKNNGASFTFANQSVKFIWMSLPADKEFKVSYKIVVAAGTIGDKVVTGKFSYVSDNVKQTVEITPATVKVGDVAATPAPPIAVAPKPPVTPTPAAPTPVETAKPVAATPEAPSSSAVTLSTDSGEQLTVDCFRKTSASSKSPGEFPVEVTIKKGNLGGFAKLIETLPVGFSATVIEAQGAAFSFVDQKVKFVWGTLPTQAEFKVSYKIIVAPNLSGDQTIESGIFSFIENDKTRKFVLQPTTIKVGANEVGQPIALEPKTTTPPPAVPEKETPVTPPVAITKPKTEKVAKEVSATNIPAPQGKVNYKVQILALHNPKSTDVVASIFGISEQINTEMGDGFKKYTVGSHNEYKAARDAREQIPSAVKAPFVTAYNAGNRITVQEALMITSQKWFR